ncbi:MAG TPA: response regulator [Rhizobiaceae bacterium]|nr:response regulator [Rhizobiaceae bacterium]
MQSPEPVKFLLVDDLDENLRALEALLRRDGLILHKARSGAQALELMLEHDYSLALLDVQMPEIDGYELAELMRGTERTRHIPIIFITAMSTDEGRRFRGYEAGAVDYVFKPIDPLILRSKAKVFFDIGQQRQELARQRNELHITASQLSEALHRLKAHADNSPLAIVEFDPELRLLSWSKGAERMFGWSAGELVGRRLGESPWLPKESAEDLIPYLGGMLAGGAPDRGFDFVGMAHRSGATVDCEWYGSVLRDSRNQPISLNVQILDVTERRRAAHTQRLLIGELNHRVKNTLANVQAIASQTLRHTRDPELFAKTFSGRIQSLARAHGMLSATTWQGARLEDLIRDQLKIGTIDAARLSVSGPDVELAPTAALRMAMILHELSTNASKYGALSNSEGRIALSWTVDGDRLQIFWREAGGPPTQAPSRQGFGTTLIEQSARADGGSASATYSSEGVAWTISMTLKEACGLEPGAGKRAPRPKPFASAPDGMEAGIRDRSYLVVEDEAFVALELVSILEGAGARAVGPATTIDEALRLIEAGGFEAAFLDGNLHGQPVEEVAAALTRRNIPFCFVSGYGRESLPSGFGATALIDKPFSSSALIEAAADLTASRSGVLKLRAT